MAKFCGNCGKPLEEGARFCRFCGTALSIDDPVPEDDELTHGIDRTYAGPQGAQQTESAPQWEDDEMTHGIDRTYAGPQGAQQNETAPQWEDDEMTHGIDRTYAGPQESLPNDDEMTRRIDYTNAPDNGPQNSNFWQNPQQQNEFQQNEQQFRDPQHSVPPKKKSKAGLIAAIVVGVIILAGGVIAGLHFSGIIDVVSLIGLSDNGKDEEEETEAPSEKATEKATAKPSEKPSEKPSPKPSEKPSEDTDADEPEEEDFDWFYGDMGTGAPDDSTILTGYDKVKGSWKMILQYYGTYQVVFLGNLEISGDSSSISAEFTPYSVKLGSSFEECDKTPYSNTASLVGGTLMVSGDIGEMQITEFFELDGTQYAVGQLTDTDGDTAYVGLVRK